MGSGQIEVREWEGLPHVAYHMRRQEFRVADVRQNAFFFYELISVF